MHIIGDRQEGKTELLLALGETLIRQGQSVLYVAEDANLARNGFYRAEASVYGLPGYRAYRTNGDERLTHESGGVLRFTSQRREWRGHIFDTLILDDVRDYEHPMSSMASSPAARVVRATR